MFGKTEKFIIKKSKPLKGTVTISGSKNSTLPIMAATILSNSKCVINDVPILSDIHFMKQILVNLGIAITFDEKNNKLEIFPANKIENEISYELISKLRASFLICGPILSKYGKVKIPLPGGCSIGSRPIDLHLKGFAALGAKISKEHGYIIAKCKKLKGANIYLDFPSVGATENIMMAATLAEGQTIIENCALEPEIVDLAHFLNSIGADIKGAGTETIKINGKKELHGCTHTVIPDRIEAGTYMIAAAITSGDIKIKNIVIEHLKPIVAKLKEMNILIEEKENGIKICRNNELLKNVDIKTMPDPGFPSDMQSQFMTLLSLVKGTSLVTETVFENRFMQAPQLNRMGANIKIEGRIAIIEGVNYLTGTNVKATDLRAGAALVLSGLVAEGETEISDIYHIDRGYSNIEKKLKDLGAEIIRLN